MGKDEVINEASRAVSPEWRTRNGTPVIVREIQAEDEPLMIKFHQGLSERSVYMRYFESLSLASRTKHARLARVCRSVPGDETVLIVLSKAPAGREEILAVARLSKLPGANAAEVAVLVSDGWQGQGLGTELMKRLVDCARVQHISHLNAEMLRDNTVMQSVFKKLGFRLRQLNDPRTIRAVLEL